MAGEQLREQCLAFDKLDITQIPTVEIDKVEGIEDQLVAGAFRKRVLKERETADALIVEHDDLAVDDRLSARQLGESVWKVAVALRPVEPGACDKPRIAVFDMGN